MADEHPTEDEALGHASRDGHTCGHEESLRTFALAVVQKTDAEHVWVTPEYTFVGFTDHVVRYANGPEMREALDRYLLTGESPKSGAYQLLPPTS